MTFMLIKLLKMENENNRFSVTW